MNDDGYGASAVVGIFRINLLGIPGAHGRRPPDRPQQLVWLFVHAYHWHIKLGTPVHFLQCGTRIRADLIADNILYAVFDIGLGNIGYGGKADGIAVGNLGVGKPRGLSFVQFKQYLAALQNRFTVFWLRIVFWNTARSSSLRRATTLVFT